MNFFKLSGLILKFSVIRQERSSVFIWNDIMAKRTSFAHWFDLVLARNLKYKQNVWKADSPVESTLLSQKIKAIF